jgi:WD40 repeat protein
MTTFKGHKNTISSIVAFDHLLASSSYDGTIKIWNLKTK